MNNKHHRKVLMFYKNANHTNFWCSLLSLIERMTKTNDKSTRTHQGDPMKKTKQPTCSIQHRHRMRTPVVPALLLFFSTLLIKASAFQLPKTTARTCTRIRRTATPPPCCSIPTMIMKYLKGCQKQSFSISMVASGHQKCTKYFSSWGVWDLHSERTRMMLWIYWRAAIILWDF